MKSNFLKALVFLIPFFTFSQKTEYRNVENRIAISGYDPVTYIEQNKAVKGNKNFAVNVNGAIYYTSSANNKKLFQENPFKYEPVYGGWCAFAMGDSGEKVSVNPNTFKIIGGKTYLFYNKFFMNKLDSWNKNERELKTNADKNWKNCSK